VHPLVKVKVWQILHVEESVWQTTSKTVPCLSLEPYVVPGISPSVQSMYVRLSGNKNQVTVVACVKEVPCHPTLYLTLETNNDAPFWPFLTITCGGL